MAEESNKLYVGNLPYGVDDAKLAEIFSAYSVVEATVIMDRYADPDRPRSRGFGFVTVESQEMAEKAVKEMNGQELEGRALVVNVARPQSEKSERRSFGSRR